MESLYRKYRPQTFSDVVGQGHVVGTLERAVSEDRVSHAYLFCGPRGTGKTTMARLLAKALMCEQGPGHLPDGTCEQCQLIAAGEHPDVYELDAASRTGVDNVREEIIGRVGYAPVQARYKLYIIDEVHMLTTQAFNALLKTLEEPPDHVVFVLCTTDPQKIPATILSRVQRFDFRPIGNDDIERRLVFVCEQEGFTYEEEALRLVVASARGGMRDALSTLEQLSVFGEGTISLDAARDLLGAATGGTLEAVVDALAARDVATLFGEVSTLVNTGNDLLLFTRALAAHLRDVYVVTCVGADPALVSAGADLTRLVAEAKAFASADRLARALMVLGEVSQEMTTAPNQRLVLEIAFTRMARPETDLTLESLAERVAELEGRLREIEARPASSPVTADVWEREAAAPAKAPASATAASPAPSPAPTPAPAPVRASQRTEEPSRQQAAPAAAPQRRREPSGEPMPQEPQTRPERPSSPPAVERTAQAQARPPRARQQEQRRRQESAAQQAPQAAPATAAPASAAITDRGTLQRMWKQVSQNLLQRYPARGTLLANSVIEDDDGQTLTVALPQGSVFALRMLERADVRKLVDGVVREVFGARGVTFKEGVGTDLKLPRSARTPDAPARPAPQNATPVSESPTFAAPAPAPAPVPAAVPTPGPAPEPTRPAARPSVPVEAPKQQDAYVAPWDPLPEEAAPAPVEDGYAFDDTPPYEEMDFTGYLAPDDEGGFEPAAVPTTGRQETPAPAPAREIADARASRRSPASAQAPAPAPAAAPAPVTSSASAAAAQAATDVPGPPELEELPDELAAILANAFEVFGDVKRIG